MHTTASMDKIAEDYIRKLFSQTPNEVILLKEYTIKKPYGNIYIYNSKKYIEDNDFNYALVGNAPFLVDKKTGKITIFGTAYDIEHYISEYEAGKWVPSVNR